MRGPGLTPAGLPQSRFPGPPRNPRGAFHADAPRSFQETRTIETYASVATVPPARLFGRRRSPASWGEIALLGVVVIVVYIVKACGRSNGPTPPSSFHRFRR